ncbi:asparagine synthase-related protein [Nostoc sp.]|uniref:asparagine synthase-related protein n=1 Tax=Nostoc sp. TaxID=1180 RepID=UPI002FFA1EDE
MLFDAFKNRKSPKIEFIKTNLTWRVAWGTVDVNYENIAWRDEKISVILPRTTSEFPMEKLAVSSRGRFVVVGDVWLTNRVQLLQKLGIEPDSFQGSSLQLVANLWEQWGNESLSQLIGMFALVIWDRDKQVLRLVRDRIGVHTLYYTTTGSVRWIAPQLRTLAPHRSSDLDLVALRDYLCCAFVPGERTLWEQVRELRPGGSVTNQDALCAYLISFQKCAVDLPQLLKPEVWTAVQTAPWVFAEDLYSQASYLNRLMAMNIKFKGADQILTKVSNLTQAVLLQGRSPLFDQRIVDLSMEIPPEYKLSGVEEKAVLKQAITYSTSLASADILPDKIIHRPKSGMMGPVQLGFRKYWQREAKDLLLNQNAYITPYLNKLPIRSWLNYQGDTWSRYGVKLWLLASLEIWLQVNQKVQ